MPSTRLIPLAIVLAAVVYLTSSGPVFAAKQPHKAVVKEEPIAELTPPAPAPTPEQMPAAPPQVTFQSGMLTIVSQNSTLGDILRAVHARTGAAIDVPPNATERVVAKLGPGPARDVLASLLNGSHFNYVMLGSATDASALDRLILTPKAASGSVAYQPPPQQPPSAQVQAANDEDDSADEDSDDEGDDDTAQADSQNGNASGNEEEPQQVQPLGQGQPGLPGVRTPEQILQQLRQQQLQQQQQGQQPGAPPPNGGQPFPGQPFPNQPEQQPPN